MSRKVFIGNLNFETTEDRLRDAFSQAGNVVDVHIPVNRETGRPRGFAFITYETESEGEAAIEQLNGADLDGRALRVDVAQESPRRSGGGNRFNGGGNRFNDGGGDRFNGGGDGGGPPRFKRGGGSRRGLRGRKRSL